MEAAIEAGAEDVASDDEGHTIYAAFEDLGRRRRGAGGGARPGQVDRRGLAPKSEVPVTGDEAAKLVKLIDGLEDDDDVQNVFGNYAIEDAELERLAG